MALIICKAQLIATMAGCAIIELKIVNFLLLLDHSILHW